jgi:hypothetical protein
MPRCFVADLWTKQTELGLDDLSVAYVSADHPIMSARLKPCQLGGTAFEAG